MKTAHIVIFVLAVALSLLAATYRFNDSAHAMGVLKKGGSMARHPAVLNSRDGRATLIVTARVVPPYRGDARVVLEGAPGHTCTMYNAEPAVRFPFHHRPAFAGSVYSDLRPHDKVALWVVLKPAGEVATAAGPPPASDATDCCLTGEGEGAPVGAPSRRPRVSGPQLAFYDLKSNERLLAVPIRFVGREGGERHGK